jgi:hypothetical protein
MVKPLLPSAYMSADFDRISPNRDFLPLNHCSNDYDQSRSVVLSSRRQFYFPSPHNMSQILALIFGNIAVMIIYYINNGNVHPKEAGDHGDTYCLVKKYMHDLFVLRFGKRIVLLNCL